MNEEQTQNTPTTVGKNNAVKVIGIIIAIAAIVYGVITMIGGMNTVNDAEENIEALETLFEETPTQEEQVEEVTTEEVVENNQAQQNTNLQTYTNSQHGLSIQYPSNFEAIEGFMGSVVAFMSPQESVDDDFFQNVNILTEDIAGYDITLEEYTQLTIDGINALVTNATFEDQQTQGITVDGNEAVLVQYTGVQGQYTLRFKQVLTLVGDTAYVFTYTANAENTNDAFKDVFMQMLETVRLR